MQKQITLTIEQAREMLGKDPAMDQLIRANFTEDELNPQPKYPKRWEDLGRVSGWYVDEDSDVRQVYRVAAKDTNYDVFATEQQARSFGIIYPQLTQLMKAYRGEWEPDWEDRESAKSTIEFNHTGVNIQIRLVTRMPISFPTHEIAEQFLNDHRELIEEFFNGM